MRLQRVDSYEIITNKMVHICQTEQLYLLIVARKLSLYRYLSSSRAQSIVIQYTWDFDLIPRCYLSAMTSYPSTSEACGRVGT